MSKSALPRAPLSQRLKSLIDEYGTLAFGVYFGIFAFTLVAFALAIQFGFHTASAAGRAGVWGAAYLATKATQPLRIVVTLALTPLLPKLLRRDRSDASKV